MQFNLGDLSRRMISPIPTQSYLANFHTVFYNRTWLNYKSHPSLANKATLLVKTWLLSYITFYIPCQHSLRSQILLAISNVGAHNRIHYLGGMDSNLCSFGYNILHNTIAPFVMPWAQRYTQFCPSNHSLLFTIVSLFSLFVLLGPSQFCYSDLSNRRKIS